ncbi:MAG: DMT family transporter [Ornithinimicrobium sp.]
MTSTRPVVPVLVQFVLLALFWGSSFFLIAIGLQGLSPLQVTWARLVVGCVTLLILCVLTHQRLPLERRVWVHTWVLAVLFCVVPFTLFGWAQQQIPSGLASIYNATTPLLAMAFATALLRTERLNLDRTAGLVLGAVGVLIIVGPWTLLAASGPEVNLMGQLACLGATTCYGLAFGYQRRFVSPLGLPPMAVATLQVSWGAALMTVLTPVLDNPPVHITTPVVLSMLSLGAFGTGLAYVLNSSIIREWGASNASAVTYLTPVVGVSLGVLLLGEPVLWRHGVGAFIVILGIGCAHGRLRRPQEQVATAGGS